MLLPEYNWRALALIAETATGDELSDPRLEARLEAILEAGVLTAEKTLRRFC